VTKGTPWKSALKRGYGDLSATHVEYKEARKEKKRILFYIRDRLIADSSAWKANKRPKEYKPTWAESPHDAFGLFGLIDEHQKLEGGGDDPGTNNWSWPFTSSLDLRRDLRKRLAADAFRSTGEKLIRQGQVPILMIVGQGVSAVGEQGGVKAGHQRFTFNLVNAGQVAAIGVQGDLLRGETLIAGGNDSRVGAIMPNNADNPARIAFDVSRAVIAELFGEATTGDSAVVSFSVRIGY
jgi:hypothetical protein